MPRMIPVCLLSVVSLATVKRFQYGFRVGVCCNKFARANLNGFSSTFLFSSGIGLARNHSTVKTVVVETSSRIIWVDLKIRFMPRSVVHGFSLCVFNGFFNRSVS